MTGTRRKRTPEPEDVPPEARYTARGLKRWIEERRARKVPEDGYQAENGIAHCPESCTLHDHS